MDLWLIGAHRGAQIRYPLAEGVHAVGRSFGNDLSLASQTVSRRHAEIRVEGNSVRVTDHHSSHGTFVNEERLIGTRALRPGDRIEFGSVPLRLRDEGTAPESWAKDGSVEEQIQLASCAAEETGPDLGPDSRGLSLLVRASKLMIAPDSLDETFERVAELVDEAIPADRVMILEQSRDGELIQRAARYRGAKPPSRLMLSESLARRVLEGTGWIVSDGHALREVRSAMIAPFMHADRPLGILYVDTRDPDTRYTDRNLRVLCLLGHMLGSRVVNTRLIEGRRERELFRAELATAAHIQRRLLPRAFPDIPGYDICGTQRMCEQVGGDLYDVSRTLLHRYQIVLGDVSGKGIGAALLMADVLGAIRVLRELGLPPDDVVSRLDRHLAATTEPELFVTLFFAELSPKSHTIDYVSAGHVPALLVLPNDEVRPLERTGMPVGLVFRLPGSRFVKKSVEFPPGASLVVYSDGITESKGSEDWFGSERLVRVLKDCKGQSAKNTVDHVLSAVSDFVGHDRPVDDTTMLVLRRRD